MTYRSKSRLLLVLATGCAISTVAVAAAQIAPAKDTSQGVPSHDLTAAGAPAAPTGMPADPTLLSATLDGPSEVPGPANPDGSGALKARLFIHDGKFCYTLTSAKLTKLTAAHIHAGAIGVAGDPVITLLPDVPSETCLKIDSALALKIAQDPAAYYVNIHTIAFPKGAIRGQLAPSS